MDMLPAWFGIAALGRSSAVADSAWPLHSHNVQAAVVAIANIYYGERGCMAFSQASLHARAHGAQTEANQPLPVTSASPTAVLQLLPAPISPPSSPLL